MSLTLHIVPHTHWDREWYRPFQTFRVRLVRLMDRLLDILGGDGNYQHFMLDGQTIVLDDYLEIRPERADEIRRFVRMGRLAIGPWYVLPDEFLVAPESLVRNLILGDRDCRRFGHKMNVGYAPDPFGHIAQLPQILRGFGIEGAAFRRGLDDEPVELAWEAPDGSRVRVSYLRDGYDNVARLPTDPDAFVAAIRAARDSLATHARSSHLLLLAGTDHQEAQPELPSLIAHANDGQLDGGDRLVHSSLPDYFRAIHATATETVQGELRSPKRHHLLPGVLSTRMWISQRNDAVETLLTRWAEPFTAWAELLKPAPDAHTHLTGHEPAAPVREPRAFLWQAWRLLLQNHPHDSICGCSVDQVHREMAPRFDQTEQIAEAIADQSLNTIAAQVDTASALGDQGAGQPIVVFNPVEALGSAVVTAHAQLAGPSDAIQVIGPNGQPLPHQIVGDGARAGRQLFRVEFGADELTSYLRFVQGGRVLNHVVHHVDLHRKGDVVHILLTMGANGEPDHARMSSVQAQVDEMISAGDATRVVIRGLIAETRELVLVAPNLPAHGYATFTVRATAPGGFDNPPKPDGARDRPQSATGDTLETDLFTIRVNPDDGTLTLSDKRNGAVYSGLNRFVDGGDRGDEYNYCRPEEDEIVAAPFAPPTVEWVETGPARQTLQISQVYRLPKSLRPDHRGRSAEPVGLPIVSRVSVSPGVPRVDIQTTVENVALDHRLRVYFPAPVSVSHAHTEAHYHVARRPVPQVPAGLDTSDWVEQPVPTVPQRGWADVSDGRVGLLVANRGLPEVEFIRAQHPRSAAEGDAGDDETTIALTLLRCVGWLSRDDMHCRQGHAGPPLPTPEAQCPGRHTFHYALIPHAGDWQNARVHADAFRAPPRAVATGVHAGPLPPVASLVQVELPVVSPSASPRTGSVEPATFVVTAVKQPEENAGLIVRGVNLSDETGAVRIRPWRPLGQAVRVNLKEEMIEPLPIDDDGTMTFTARPWEIVTVRWRDW